MSDINSVFNNVISNSSILDVVTYYLGSGAIKKQGKGYVCLCPFHNDNHPSMSLDISRNIFHCWSCNEKGGVLEFIIKYKKVSKMEALKELAKISNIPLPSDFNNSNFSQIKNKYPDEINALNDLSKFYQLMLASNLGQEARNYLEKRKLDNEVIKHFEIGYAPSDKTKSIEALEKNYSIPVLEKAGILASSNKLEDRLFDRIIFPIKDSNGVIVAFSGRALKKDNLAKYVNYSNTNLFIKGDNLFNYHEAKNVAKAMQYIYIVEGYMDAIAYYRANIKSVVATMGTALSKKQIELIKNLNVEVRLSYDNDIPGQSNQIKAINLLLSNNIKVTCVRPFIKYKDADEVFSNGGEKLLNELSSKLIDPFLFYLAFILNGRKKMDNSDEINKFVNNSKIYFSKLDEVNKLKDLEILSKITSLTTDQLNKLYLSNNKSNNPSYSSQRQNFQPKNVYTNRNNNQIISSINRNYDPNSLDKSRLEIKSFADSDEFNLFNTSQATYNFESEAIINCFYSKEAVGQLNKEKYVFSFSPFNELFYLIQVIYQNNSSENLMTKNLFQQLLMQINNSNQKEKSDEINGIDISDLIIKREISDNDFSYLSRYLPYFEAFVDASDDSFNSQNFSKLLEKLLDMKKRKL